MGGRVRQITVGDRAVACGVHRGEVILVAASRAWVLLRVDGGEPTRSGYLLCRAAEVEPMNGWWARRLRHDGRVGTRAWARGAARPVTAGRKAHHPDAGRPPRRVPADPSSAPCASPPPAPRDLPLPASQDVPLRVATAVARLTRGREAGHKAGHGRRRPPWPGAGSRRAA